MQFFSKKKKTHTICSISLNFKIEGLNREGFHEGDADGGASFCLGPSEYPRWLSPKVDFGTQFTHPTHGKVEVSMFLKKDGRGQKDDRVLVALLSEPRQVTLLVGEVNELVGDTECARALFVTTAAEIGIFTCFAEDDIYGLTFDRPFTKKDGEKSTQRMRVSLCTAGSGKVWAEAVEPIHPDFRVCAAMTSFTPYDIGLLVGRERALREVMEERSRGPRARGARKKRKMEENG